MSSRQTVSMIKRYAGDSMTRRELKAALKHLSPVEIMADIARKKNSMPVTRL